MSPKSPTNASSIAESLNRTLPAFTAIRTVLNTAHRMVYPFLSIFARGLGVDIASMSYALTVRSIIGGLGPFAASLADSRGRKFGLLFGLGLFTLGAALVVRWPTFLALALALTLTTLGKYVFDSSMQAYLSDRITYERRELAVAIAELGWSLGFIVGVPIARLGCMASAFRSWRQGWWRSMCWPCWHCAVCKSSNQ